MALKSDGIPLFTTLPSDIYFRHQELEPAEWISHSHPWGQLNYVSRGIIHLEIEGIKFLSPPQYAIWIPPRREHASFNAEAVTYRAVYVSEECSQALPAYPCALKIGAVLKAILHEFAQKDVSVPATPPEIRMAQVALDEIQACVPMKDYLPYAASKLLAAILDETKTTLNQRLTSAQIASKFNLTLRTLERRCKSELGLGFGEWRQRLRFTQALDALDAGHTIQQISFELGYRSPSAFISMFHRLSGQTPEQYRRSR